MCRVRWLAVVAAVAVLAVPGTPAAQPPTPTQPGPAQPAPVPAPTPGAPTPTPTPPTKEKEEPTPRPEIAIPQERVPETLLPTRVPGFIGPDLFNPPAHQGFITLTPSFTLGGEYNDNVFATSQN